MTENGKLILTTCGEVARMGPKIERSRICGQMTEPDPCKIKGHGEKNCWQQMITDWRDRLTGRENRGIGRDSKSRVRQTVTTRFANIADKRASCSWNEEDSQQNLTLKVPD